MKSEGKYADFAEEPAETPEDKRTCIDEGGVDKCFVRECGRALRGVKVEQTKRGKNINGQMSLPQKSAVKLSYRFVIQGT